MSIQTYIQNIALSNKNLCLPLFIGVKRLQELPRVGRRMDDDTERRQLFVPFGAGAYVLRYRVHGDTVVVIRVWHSREARE